MTKNRQNAIFSGIFFILATATYMTASSLLPASSEVAAYLTQLPTNKTPLLVAVICEIINDASCIAIGILMFRLLRPHGENIALAYLSLRSIEGAVLLVSAIGALMLLPISDLIQKGNPNDLASYQNLGFLAMKWHYYSFQIGLLATGFGGILLSYLLFVKKTVARWMSILGLVGYVLIFLKTFADLFGYDGGNLIYLPGALFELIFPLWLIFKGFGEEKN